MVEVMKNIVNSLKVMAKDLIQKDVSVVSLIGCFNVMAWGDIHELKKVKSTESRAGANAEDWLCGAGRPVHPPVHQPF